MEQHDDWNEHWDRYALAASRNPAQQMRHNIISKLLLALKAGTNEVRVLDIGSGQGDLCVKLHACFPSAALVGFELSASGVDASQKKLPAGRFIQVDIFNPGPAAYEYKNWATHAVCSEVLEHVDSPEAFLLSACSFLADGCQLVVTVPGGPMSAFDRHIGHRQHFTRKSITQVLEAGGFAVEKTYLAGFPFFNLYRLAVILRGESLAKDVDHTRPARTVTRLANCMMALFRGLFRFNLLNSPFGWQVVAVARKNGS